ncbi:fatty-acyl-CoA synthase [Marmoricola sp. URHA0025 HA25]
MTSVDINPAAAVAWHARVRPDATAVIYRGGDLSYAQLDDKSARFAAVLAEAGVGSGDRVGYLGMNSTSFLVTMLASFRLGAIYVPVNFRLAGPELSTVLERSGAQVLVCEEGHRGLVDSLSPAPPALKRYLLVDDDREVPAAEPGGVWETWTGLIQAVEPQASIVKRDQDDPAVLMFTSGTTGLPKGVILTHGNAWWNSLNVELMVDSRIGDTTHVAAPLFHIGALNSFALRSLVRGNRMVLRRAFEPEETLDDYAEYGVNSTFAVPAMFQAMQRSAAYPTVDLKELRSVVVAGAPVPPSLIRDWSDRGVLLQQAWGLTETAPFATHLPADWTLSKIGSAGVAMPYTEVMVVDADNKPVPEGERGEILVRGPNVTPGYWKNPEATGAAFDAEGWFHTGDIGYLDEDECLFIVDRLKDMIISGGENVYPAEVERALADLPGLGDIAVIGVPDEKWGEAVVAIVSLEPGASITLDDVRDHAAKHLARYKLPSRLMVVEAVPRNASGKLDKGSIRRLVDETSA